jgi:hypothetical protein
MIQVLALFVKPITFDPFNNAYHVVGEKVGEAWKSGKSLM